MEVNRNTHAPARPNPYGYLAAISAICHRGLISSSEEEALAAVRAISEDTPRWLVRWGFPLADPAIQGLMPIERLLLRAGRPGPERALTAGGSASAL